MNEEQYEEWSHYYDVTDEVEFREVNICISGKPSPDLWNQKRVLEVGSGSGRFTLKYADRTSLTLAIDPDEERIKMMKVKVNQLGLSDKCCPIAGELCALSKSLAGSDFLEEKFDVIVFPWSWAYIDNKIETYDVAKSLLAKDGMMVFTMVVDGEFEKFVIERNHLHKHLYETDAPNDLNRNIKSMNLLKELMEEDQFQMTKRSITTSFKFDNIDVASRLIYPLLIEEDMDEIKPALEMYSDDNGRIIMSDELLCVVARSN